MCEVERNVCSKGKRLWIVDDEYFTLVDGRETVPMAVWVTHPFSPRFFGGRTAWGRTGTPSPV